MMICCERKWVSQRFLSFSSTSVISFITGTTVISYLRSKQISSDMECGLNAQSTFDTQTSSDQSYLKYNLLPMFPGSSNFSNLDLFTTSPEVRSPEPSLHLVLGERSKGLANCTSRAGDVPCIFILNIG